MTKTLPARQIITMLNLSIIIQNSDLKHKHSNAIKVYGKQSKMAPNQKKTTKL